MGGDNRPGLGANGERRQKVEFQNRRKNKKANFKKYLDKLNLECYTVLRGDRCDFQRNRQYTHEGTRCD